MPTKDYSYWERKIMTYLQQELYQAYYGLNRHFMMLFIMAIEPLAIAVRTHQNITGISIWQQEHRLALFADDVIIYLKNMEKSIPELLKLLEVFGKISGYKLNKSKSSITFLNQLENKAPPKIGTQFTTVDCFTYLGIQIVLQLKYIVESNYQPILQEISKLL